MMDFKWIDLNLCQHFHFLTYIDRFMCFSTIYLFVSSLQSENGLQFTPKLKPLDRFYGRRSDLDVQILQIIFSVSLGMYFIIKT